jgi:hypothetical protein
MARFSGLFALLGLLIVGCTPSLPKIDGGLAAIDLDSIAPAAGGPLAVRGSYLGPYATPDEAAYYALLLAGEGMRKSPEMVAISEAFEQLPNLENSGPTMAMDRAIIAAPIAVSNIDGEAVNLACDYDWSRAATWIDTLARTRDGAALSGRLGPKALGFITTEENIEQALWWGDIEALNEAGIVYVDLSGVSKGYVGEVVSRLVNGLREQDVRSHIGSLAVIRTISVFERIGDTVLVLGDQVFSSEARAAQGDGC